MRVRFWDWTTQSYVVGDLGKDLVRHLCFLVIYEHINYIVPYGLIHSCWELGAER